MQEDHDVSKIISFKRLKYELYDRLNFKNFYFSGQQNDFETLIERISRVDCIAR